MYKLPTMEAVEEVIVNKSVVKNNNEPIIIHIQKEKKLPQHNKLVEMLLIIPIYYCI